MKIWYNGCGSDSMNKKEYFLSEQDKVLVERYLMIEKENNDLISDISYTIMALENKKIDYQTKREYENDLINDRRRIEELAYDKKQLLEVIEINNYTNVKNYISDYESKKEEEKEEKKHK